MYTPPGSSEKAKDAGLALVLICMLLFRYYKLDIFFFASLVLLLVTMTFPAVFKVWGRLWFGISELLGKYISMLIISIAFFCIVTPIALIRKALGKDSLMLRRWKCGSESVMQERNHLFTKKDMERPY